MQSIRSVVLAGGGGTRLWPLSREHFPKQFLALAGSESLLQQTVLRLSNEPTDSADSSFKFEDPVLVCNEEHRFLVAQQAKQVGIKPAAIVLEPAGKNTAPALTCASLLVNIQEDILLVTPADHAVQNTADFRRVMVEGARHAANGAIVTFGIRPNRPETGYGYIRCGEGISGTANAWDIAGFVEKPDSATAQSYLESGNYLWNSGMFMVKASVWLDAIRRFRPDIAEACQLSVTEGSRDDDFFRLGRPSFLTCPSDSIDYAVMEKVGTTTDYRSVVLALDVGWSDVGSWSSLWDLHDHDENGNATQGDVCALDSRNSFVLSENRFVAVLGCDDLIVVETADAVMVVPKSRAQDVKRINEWLKARKREERVVHRRVYRPWGSYEGIDAGERFQVKRIQVKPGAQLSLQMHHHRAEHWIVVRGTAKVVRGDEEFLLTENQSTYIPLGVKHRLVNPGTIPLELIEVQSGPYLGEDDIVRYEDVYNRA